MAVREGKELNVLDSTRWKKQSFYYMVLGQLDSNIGKKQTLTNIYTAHKHEFEVY